LSSEPETSPRPSSAEAHLRRALRLAARGRYRAPPNPLVGAVIVQDDGCVVGEGHHARVGGPHAEVVALAQAGARARGATLYVSLEPCSHHGRTPPCTDAVLAAGLRRVVACHGDPDPRVRGEGFRRLRAAGVEVEVGPLAAQAVALNLPYLVARTLGRPFVTLKWAMSLDGKIATASGESQWISSPPARRWALEQRELHGAILVGIGTVLADDPRLTRRLHRADGPILRVVLDRRLRTPPGARLFDEAGPVRVYTEASEAARTRALEERGGQVIRLSEVTPEAVLADLAGAGIGAVLVEGGGEVAAAFVAAGCYDRVLAVVAPRLIAGRGAAGPLAGAGWLRLEEAPRLEGLASRRLGPDLLLSGVRAGCSQALLRSVEASSEHRSLPGSAACGSS
jgi:diaminohydroxyphosphoribosylaminopyrimidine deaminase / 5-amino-6-(5-phosphoribosylamino)uracil reductase